MNKDYYATLKIQNGRLIRAIHVAEFANANRFAKENNICPTLVGQYLNFRTSPRRLDGRWKFSVLRICKRLAVEPSEIFPEHLIKEISTNQITAYVEQAQLESGPLHYLTQHRAVDEKCIREVLEESMSTLTEMERDVLKRQFWNDENLSDIGKAYGLTRERIRQYLNKALRKLRHPVRSERLEGFLS